MSQNQPKHQSPRNQPQKGLRALRESRRLPFSGFIAHYDDGKAIQERENFFSKKLNKQCATSWAEINRVRLAALEIMWRDQSKIVISTEEYPHIKPQDWFFSQNGYLDLSARRIVVVARNIGFVKDGLLHIYSVHEETGNIRTLVRGV